MSGGLESAGHDCLRDEDFESDMPLGALSGLEGDHAGVGFAPHLAEGIAEVVLVFDGDEVLGRRRVDLDGLDFR